MASGGVVFTTIQKFAAGKGERYPLLSDRRNIVVIADEAHRSQYDFIDGFARHLREACPTPPSSASPARLAHRAGFQPHLRNKARRELIKKRFKDPEIP